MNENNKNMQMLVKRLATNQKLNKIQENILLDLINNRIPAKFLNADLSKTEKQIQKYYSQSRYETKGLYLYGQCGSGKTYSIYALTIYLLANGYDIRVVNLPQLFNIIRSSFNKQSAYDESTGFTSYAFVHDMNDVDKLINIEMLAIDDIGKEKATDWVAETLYYIINTRYENEKITFFTSNLDLDNLADKVGDSIVSRITEMSEIYKLSGKDKRI